MRRPRLAHLRATFDNRPPAPFIVGVGRSGTTLLRLMLDAHPDLAIPPETHFVPDVIGLCKSGASPDRLAAEIRASRHWADLGFQRDELEHAFAEIGSKPKAAPVLRTFYERYAAREGKARWGDKTPGYLRRMSLIAASLPEARFIHLIRDGRDVVLSRRRRGMGADLEIGRGAARWRDRILAARRQGDHLGSRRYMEVRYEDLIEDPEAALGDVCDFAGLGFEPAMLRYHERSADRLEELGDLPAEGARTARSAAERRQAHALTAAEPSAERAGAWREAMSAGDRAAFEAEAGTLLRELGYPVED
jgi:hypothetical protein